MAIRLVGIGTKSIDINDIFIEVQCYMMSTDVLDVIGCLYT